MQSFRILKPIVNQHFVEELIKRLENGESGAVGNGAKVNTTLLHSKKACFYSCSCEDYLHYLWCTHVCVKCLKDNLIQCPSNLNPARIQPVAQSIEVKKGRPARAKRGGAWERLH